MAGLSLSERVMVAILPPEMETSGSGGLKVTARGERGERFFILIPS